MTDVAVRYDPYAADIRENPYPIYQYLRDEAPIYRNPDKGFYVLSRFADVLGVLHDWETYSSAKGITLEGLPPDVQPEMITMDPPRHDELRDLVKRAFTPKAIGALEPRVVAIAAELAAALDPDGFDLVRDVAGPVPSVVICELLGIPDQRPAAVPGLDRDLDPAQARRARHDHGGTRRERRTLGVPRRADRRTSAQPHRRHHRIRGERGRGRAHTRR